MLLYCKFFCNMLCIILNFCVAPVVSRMLNITRKSAEITAFLFYLFLIRYVTEIIMKLLALQSFLPPLRCKVPAVFAGAPAEGFFEFPAEMEGICKTQGCGTGGYRHPGGTEQAARFFKLQLAEVLSR